MRFSCFILILTITIFHTSVCLPQGKDGQNLRYTFGEGEELPEGFFDGPELMEKRSTGRRRNYPPCQDGSGGICIEAGQCPPDKKAEAIEGRVACTAPRQECCHGGPMNTRTPCRDRGGECTAPPRSCGNGPQIRNGTECNHSRLEICCIWVF